MNQWKSVREGKYVGEVGHSVSPRKFDWLDYRQRLQLNDGIRNENFTSLVFEYAIYDVYATASTALLANGLLPRTNDLRKDQPVY